MGGDPSPSRPLPGDALRWDHHHKDAAPRQVSSFGQTCESAAERIRISARLTGRDIRGEQPAIRSMLWLPLLLWALGCAGLFVSVLLQTNDLDLDPGMAAGEVVNSERLSRCSRIVPLRAFRRSRCSPNYGSTLCAFEDSIPVIGTPPRSKPSNCKHGLNWVWSPRSEANSRSG
jgi:hypothetical protein